MLAVRGVYNAGKVLFLGQNLPQEKSAVIVTFLDKEETCSEKVSLIYKNPRLRKLLKFKKEDNNFICSLHNARQKAYHQFMDNMDFLQKGR